MMSISSAGSGFGSNSGFGLCTGVEYFSSKPKVIKKCQIQGPSMKIFKDDVAVTFSPVPLPATTFFSSLLFFLLSTGSDPPRSIMARAGGMTNAVNVGIAVQADWENREFIANISLNVRRLFDFLLQFEATTKSKLAALNEKLDILERRLEVLEVQLDL
ncbi:hypothetical protein Cni_G01512 [Canna indica]|uniref:Protein BRICK1 n=1 Tax=Canna indica TaxID=4628 RepID=A0AAQ3PYC6_9LILI|nr:hypothetical protein Cni_G01512 [Canna indica]